MRKIVQVIYRPDEVVEKVTEYHYDDNGRLESTTETATANDDGEYQFLTDDGIVWAWRENKLVPLYAPADFLLDGESEEGLVKSWVPPSSKKIKPAA